MRPKSDLTEVKTITATKALAKRGMTMLRAKRAVETMIDKGEAVIEVPIVEDVMTFYNDLAKAGISASRIASEPLDLQAVRVGRGLTQEQFARRYNLALDAIQNWERGVRTPDRSMQSYLRVIAAYPEIAARAQEQNTD
jgi:putative transcriptional regulator